jgi:hypothetical protein
VSSPRRPARSSDTRALPAPAAAGFEDTFRRVADEEVVSESLDGALTCSSHEAIIRTLRDSARSGDLGAIKLWVQLSRESVGREAGECTTNERILRKIKEQDSGPALRDPDQVPNRFWATENDDEHR